MSNIDLLFAFYSYESCRGVFEKVIEALKEADPAVAVLALEGLFRIEEKVNSKQFCGLPLLEVKTILRKWRCESPLRLAYSGQFHRAPDFLKGLTIFKTLEVPLFIDDYGEKKLLSSFEDKIDVKINGNTPIFHVTHKKEAAKIYENKEFKPSDKKNAIKGTWFGLDNPTVSGSVYGSYSFKTTLSQLGVKGLHQGEVVAYKNEVNVILYAADDTRFSCNKLKKPTDKAVTKTNDWAYVKVSIFVPARFLPATPAEFRRVVSRPTKVPHGSFCVRQMRSPDKSHCKELGLL